MPGLKNCRNHIIGLHKVVWDWWKMQTILLFVLGNHSIMSNRKQLDTKILYYDKIVNRVERSWMGIIIYIAW